LKRCERIERRAWRQANGFLSRLESDWAHFLLARVDPFVALRQFRALK
jgi:hypothetical protein